MELNENFFITEEVAFEAHLDTCKDWPEAILKFKKDSWQKYKAEPFPTNKDEGWRFSNLYKQDLGLFSLKDSSQSNHEVSDFDLALQNNSVIHYKAKTPGLIFEPICTAVYKHPELILENFRAQDEQMGCKKYLYLHAAYLQNGYLLCLPENLKLSEHINIIQVLDKNAAAIFPTNIIVAKANTECTIFETYLSTDPSFSGFCCTYNSVHLDKHAKLFKKTIQNFNLNTLSYHIEHNSVEKEAHLKTLSINIGSHALRTESQVTLKQVGAQADMYALSLAKNNQFLDQRTLQIHTAPSTRSNLLYKNALYNKAQTIFSGLIKVSPEAQKTDAYQKNRNLLLSENAQAHSLPGLEILANDVKCSHGATTSPIDNNELYYLLSRGIAKENAQKLLTLGFFNEVLEHLQETRYTEIIQSILEENS